MTLNPSDFQTAALAWISVTLVVGTAAIAAIGVLWGKVQSLKDAHAENRADIRSVNDQITTVAAAMPTAAPVVIDQTGDRP
jgi:hypothetical protein